MARGRKTSFTISLTPAERHTLLRWQRSRRISVGVARRGRVILLMAEQMPISQIAITVGVSRRFVYKWMQRFIQGGLDGLAEKLRGPKHERRQPPLPEQHDVRA